MLWKKSHPKNPLKLFQAGHLDITHHEGLLLSSVHLTSVYPDLVKKSLGFVGKVHDILG